MEFDKVSFGKGFAYFLVSPETHKQICNRLLPFLHEDRPVERDWNEESQFNLEMYEYQFAIQHESVREPCFLLLTVIEGKRCCFVVVLNADKPHRFPPNIYLVPLTVNRDLFEGDTLFEAELLDDRKVLKLMDCYKSRGSSCDDTLLGLRMLLLSAFKTTGWQPNAQQDPFDIRAEQYYSVATQLGSMANVMVQTHKKGSLSSILFRPEKAPFTLEHEYRLRMRWYPCR
jgi:hypothetical protein